MGEELKNEFETGRGKERDDVTDDAHGYNRVFLVFQDVFEGG